MSRNDFAAAFLQGLYNSGVGNPEVQRQEEQDKLQRAYYQSAINKNAADAGMVPDNTVHPETNKVLGMVKNVLFPGSNDNNIQMAFKPDPNNGYVDASGNLSTTPTPGATQVPSKEFREARIKLGQTPQYVIPQLDADGNVTGFTPLKKGEKPTGFAKPSANKNAQKASGEVQLIDEQLSQIEKLKGLLDKGVSGPVMGRAANVLSKLTGGAIQQPLSEFNALKPAIATKIYRAMTGDTRLSDADAAARAYPLLPSPGDDASTQQAKWQNIKDLLNARRQQFDPNGEIKSSISSPSGSGDFSGGHPAVGQTFNGRKITHVEPLN